MKRVSLISALASAIILSSCMGTAPVQRPAMPLYNGPVSADALASRIAFSSIPGLRAEIQATIWQGGERTGPLKGALLMRPSGEMRVVLYNTFGSTVLDIVQAGGRLEAYMPAKDSMYVGEAPSIMPPEGSEMVLASGEDGHYMYAMLGGRLVREYAFDPASALNTSATVISGGRPVMEARFTEHFPGHGGTLPRRAVILYDTVFRLELTIHQPEAGPVPLSLFPLGRSASRVYDLSSRVSAE